MTSSYRTKPSKADGMPSGIPYIVGNEAAERFSFYGMKAILAVFMTEHLVNRSGDLAVMSNTDAKFYLHSFVVAGYLFPLIGAILADWIFGKYRTILWLSIIYCLGHLSLAVDETRLGLGRDHQSNGEQLQTDQRTAHNIRCNMGTKHGDMDR